MSNEIRAMWPKFDALIEKAENLDTKLFLEAIKLQAELMNLRLAAIEQAASYQQRMDARQSAYSNPPR